MNRTKSKTQYNLEGTALWRVSHICDALGRVDSGSLVYAGSNWAADRAVSINRTAKPEYIVSPEYKQEIAASVAREQQRAADRGTLTNLVLDEYIAGRVTTIDDAADFIRNEVDRQRVESETEYARWKSAYDQGLTSNDEKPDRGYQADEDDVLPYVDSLFEFWRESGLYVVESQTFVHDDLVAGTLDYVVEIGGKYCVLDLKTRNASQVRRTDCAQIATYTRLYADGMGLGADQLKYGGVIVCTPEKTVLRFMSQIGYADGLKDFALALEIIRTSGTAGKFYSASRTRELAS